MSAEKEPCYFVDPDQLRLLQPWIWSQGYWRSQDAYLKLFEGDGNIAYAGEASTYYTHLPLATGVAERVRRFNPDARLIYIMRDPVERTISHYWHRVVHNSECRSISVAIMQDHRYRDVSHYAMQLAPYYELFGGSKIEILTLEELIENYEKKARSVFQWLNIDEFIALPQLRRENETPGAVQQRTASWGAIVGFFRQHYLLRASIGLVPGSMRNYVGRRFTREVNRLDVDIEPVVQYLRPLQREQTRALSAMTGRVFPEWKTLSPD